LFYINQNFKEEINLKILAKQFGYTAEHISRVFNHYLNVSLPEYINGLRLDYVENAIKEGSKENITSLLFSAGFKSIQTYYRAKNKRKNSHQIKKANHFL
jgi:methylphosphotriester-DNA--protein-cysteine methyltransferase